MQCTSGVTQIVAQLLVLLVRAHIFFIFWTVKDPDETVTRDLLKAVQTCPYISQLDYSSHYCDIRKDSKIFVYTQNYEGSPDCIEQKIGGFHPDMVIGACVEGIGNSSAHAPAKRDIAWKRLYGLW